MDPLSIMMKHITKAKKKIALVAMIFALTGDLMAQTSLSLQQAQDYALQNSFQIKSSKYDAEVAQLETEALIGVGLPQVSAGLQYQNFITLATQVVDGSFFGAPGQELRLQFGTPHNMTASLSANQLLFNGSWLVGLQASRAYADLQKKNLSKSEQDIKVQVAQSYHAIVVTQERLEFLKQTRAVIAQMLDDTKAYLQNGFVEEQDVDQLQLSLNQVDNTIFQTENGISLLKDLLKFAIGMPLQEEIALTDDRATLLAPIDVLSQSFSADNTIDVQLASNALSLQQLNLKNEKAKFLPTASLFYSLQAQAFRQEFNFLDTSRPWFAPQLWGFQVNVPILSGGSKYKNVQKAKVEVQRMKDTFEVSKNAALLTYNQAKNDYETALKNFTTSEQSLQLAQRILDKTNIKYKEGVASSMDVSTSTNQVLTAQQNLAGALQTLMDAQIKLKKALNTL